MSTEHLEVVRDADPFFEIDTSTRAIKNMSSTKTAIMQYDHNSERFTFSIPRYVEEHDMLECKVEVHYINKADDTQSVYDIRDLQVDPADETKVIGTWLLSQNVTNGAGELNFLLRFSCVDAEGNVEYAWNTDICKGIYVKQGMWNTPDVVREYQDVLAQWEAELFSIEYSAKANIENKTAQAMTDIDEKVAETIDSIPDDYSALSGKVAEHDEILTDLMTVETLEDGTVNVVKLPSEDSTATDITDTLIFNSGYINIYGTIAQADNFFYSEIITLNKGTGIRIYAYIGEGRAILSKWSADGSTFIETICAGTTVTETYEHIATETEYLRISYNKYFTDQKGGLKVEITSSSIKSDCSQINGRNIVDKTAREEISNLRETIETIPSNNSLNGKTIVVDGDSITYGQGNNQNGTYKGWADILAEKTGMVISQKLAKSGARLTTGTNNSICDRVTTIQDADYIIISGGYNDYTNHIAIGELTGYGFGPRDTVETYIYQVKNENGSISEPTGYFDKTTVIGAVEYIVRYLLTTFPTKKLGFVFTHKVGYTWYSGTGGTLKDYHDAIVSVLEKYSFPYCDLTQISRFNTGTPTYAANYTNNGDAIHPNQAGYEIGYVPQIEAWLKTL